MKKVLLSLAAVGITMSANAQLLNYGFEEGDQLPSNGNIVTENWANFPESKVEFPSEKSAHTGSKSLWVKTDATCNTWERVVAFTNTGIQENKSYRISFWLKGNGSLNVALLKGCFNHDRALQAGNNDTFVDQTKTISAENDNDYVRCSYVVWSPSRDVMKTNKPDFAEDEFWNQDFLRLAFTGVGEYSIDDVAIDESTVESIVYNQKVIQVNFGYATNAEEVAEKAGGTKVLDPSSVVVKVDDEEVEVKTVEIKRTGEFYIFTADEIDGEKVTVSFKNPGDLKYSSNVAPECWTNPYCAVYDFTDEVAYEDEDLTAFSLEWEPAELVTSDPEEDSFEIGNDVNTFTFTFNKPVAYYDENVGHPIAKLTGKNVSEDLVLQSFDGFQETLTFKRPSDTPLENGEYTIKVNHVANEKSRAIDSPVAISFEVGEVTVGGREYYERENITCGIFNEGIEGNYPSGWTLIGYAYEGDSDAADAAVTEEIKVERVRTEEGGFSGSRGFDLTASPVPGAIYMRNLTWAHAAEGNPVLYYGNMEGYPLTISGDSACIRFYVSGWDGNAGTFRVTLYGDAINGQDVVATMDMATTSTSGSRNSHEFDEYEMLVYPKGERQYYLRVELATNSTAGLFGGFKVFDYVDKEGDQSKNIEYVKSYEETNDNAAPNAGTGWRIYANGAMKTPGKDYNYNGSRIFNLGIKNLKKGFYNGMSGNAKTDYIIYGEGVTYTADDVTEPKKEPTLHLPETKLQVTFKRLNWKTDAQTHTLQIIDKNTGDIVLQRAEKTEPVLNDKGEVVISVNAGGNRNAGGKVEALETKFNWYVPYEGDFLAKMFIDGEGFVGPLKITKIGSQAVTNKKALKESLKSAKEELALAQADELYAGDTRDKLAATIKLYEEEVKLHTPKAYQKAEDELASLVRAMAARRSNMTSYPTKLSDLKTILDNNAENKYANLPEYKNSSDLYDKYIVIDPLTLNDDDLSNAVTAVDNQTQLLKNMIDKIVGLWTKQIAELSAAIVNLDETLSEDQAVVAANVALKDDQTLARALKLLYTGTLYKQLGAGKEFFSKFDETIDENMPDSIDLGFMIQNREFYSTAKKSSTGAYNATVNDFAGWSIEIKQNYILSDWGWNGSFVLNDLSPVGNAAVCTGWGTSDVDVHQLVADIPAGVYTVAIQAADGTNKDSANLSTAYIVVAEAKSSQMVVNDGGSRSLLTYSFRNVTPDVNAESKTASYTVGANLKSIGDFSQCDNATLYMTGKLDGFDYAAAAPIVLKAASDKLEKVQDRTDAPVAVSYFNLNGQEVAAPQGVSLKVERYSDGYVVVKKVIVK